MHSINEDDIAQIIRQLLEYMVEWKAKNVVHLDLRVSDSQNLIPMTWLSEAYNKKNQLFSQPSFD